MSLQWEYRFQELARDLEREKTGLITNFVDGKPQFIHDVFAEYFSAQWLKENYSRLPPGALETLFAESFDEVRFFFDALLSEGLPLHEAALSGSAEAVHATLRVEVSEVALAVEDLGKRRALHLAAAHGREDVTRALLEAGSETHPRDGVLRWTPLRYADAALRLSPNGQPSSHLDVAERLLCSGALPAHAPRLLRLGKCLLHIAIEKDLAQVSRMLVKEEGPLVVQRRGAHNYMHVAAQHGSYRVIRMLLGLGFSVNAKDRRSGRTPLHLAAACGHPAACTLLLQRGARVSSRSRNGRTPLHEAASRGYVSICRILLEAGADPRAADSEGDLPVHRAACWGTESPVWLLLSAANYLVASALPTAEERITTHCSQPDTNTTDLMLMLQPPSRMERMAIFLLEPLLGRRRRQRSRRRRESVFMETN